MFFNILNLSSQIKSSGALLLHRPYSLHCIQCHETMFPDGMLIMANDTTTEWYVAENDK